MRQRPLVWVLLSVAALGLVLLPAAASAGSGNGSNQDRTAPLDVARDHLQKNKQGLGLTGADVKDAVVSDIYTDAHNGVTHVYFKQQHKGIDVLGTNLGVHLTADGAVLSVGNRFVPDLAAQIRSDSGKQSARAALVHAARELGLSPARTPGDGEAKGGAAEKVVFDGAGLSSSAIPVKLVYVPTDSGVRLAWNVELQELSGQHWWSASVDSDTGELLAAEDWISDASYNVFAIPKESPLDGGRTMEVDPHTAEASPFGWHDTNGVAGAESTLTQGNNVLATTDIDNNDMPTEGGSPEGGASLAFDFGLDLGLQPTTYRPAAVTNLFYWNNVIHDVAYNYGFTEAAGNFQVNNYGKGGTGGDAVQADAQDGSGINNANFGTGHPDGRGARMQMYVWTPPALVQVNAPPAIVGDYGAGTAAFGPQLTGTGVTGNASYVGRGCDPTYMVGNDPAAPPPLDSYLDNPAGKIAIIDRGACSFVSKVKKAQDNGAIAVIIADNAPGAAAGMAGTDATVTIPSVRVTQADGNTFKANVATLNVTLKKASDINRDSDLDNGVIAHEYGHGISNRLTGGPTKTSSCLVTATDLEHMGEGWSDYLGLVMTAKAGDTATKARGIGNYVAFQGTNGIGIRPTQYTTNMAVNPSTYDTIKNVAQITQPHGVGYVWATMVWEVYWNLVVKYGYNPDVYGNWFTGGNNLAIQLVFDGMKIQPCHPGFVDGRDAILAADRALTGGANQCEIWRGFAKRGLGTGANQGSSLSRTDGTQNFDVPSTCSAAASSFRPPIAQAPTPNSPVLNERVAGDTVPLKYTVTGLAPGQAVTLDSLQVDCVTLVPTQPQTSAAIQTAGTATQKGDEYHINWVTDAAWAGTCRRLTLRIAGASSSIAYFRFN